MTRQNKTNGVNIHEFVKELKLAKVYTQKQTRFIENLYIYFEDMKVYKVIIAVNPGNFKRAKKLGMQPYLTTYFDDVLLKFDNNNINGYDMTTGKYIAVYNPNNGDCLISTGEESVREQVVKLKRHK